MKNETSSKKIIMELKGGLGNQMFQYAAARSLALDLDATLLLDSKLGFFLDWRYRRTFQLNKLPVSYTESRLKDSFPLYINRIVAPLLKLTDHKHLNWKSSTYIFERDFSYTELETNSFSESKVWMSGYFQDPRYFAKHKEQILIELNPPLPKNKTYLELGKLSESFNLVALGIRLFEESKFPGVHARDGKNKTVTEYKSVLAKVLKSVPDPLVLVFTTKEFEFLDSLKLPLNTVFVNADRGFNDAIDKLWLMSKCQHHVFNNSTYYWWGATLSQSNYPGLDQKIFCSDNFLNQSVAYSNWETF